MSNMNDVLGEVVAERECQDKTWGVQDHNEFVWLTILMEELGEASESALEDESSQYRQELVQVAAVAVAAIEAYDRKAEGARDVQS